MCRMAHENTKTCMHTNRGIRENLSVHDTGIHCDIAQAGQTGSCN